MIYKMVGLNIDVLASFGWYCAVCNFERQLFSVCDVVGSVSSGTRMDIVLWSQRIYNVA